MREKKHLIVASVMIAIICLLVCCHVGKNKLLEFEHIEYSYITASDKRTGFDYDDYYTFSGILLATTATDNELEEHYQDNFSLDFPPIAIVWIEEDSIIIRQEGMQPLSYANFKGAALYKEEVIDGIKFLLKKGAEETPPDSLRYVILYVVDNW